MSKSHAGPWVVYRTEATPRVGATNVVCEQSEWDALQVNTTRTHTLIREGIACEPEAELLARGTSGDSKPPAHSRRL